MTSLLRDHWYVAAWQKSLDRPQRRVLLGEPIVIFRGQDSGVYALADSCPHRFAPLSMGRVIGNALQCPYHGLEFGGSGICVKNPHIDKDPGGLKVQHFACETRQGAVWVWMGDPADADPERIPSYPEFEMPDAFTVSRGYLHVKANCQLIVDNLLDLSHAEFLHATTIGIPGSASNVETRVVEQNDGVLVERRICDLEPSPMYKQVWDRTQTIDKVSNMRWRVPSHLNLDVFVTEPGGGRDDALLLPSLHLLTPETETTTHYHWAVGRNFLREDEAFGEAVANMIAKAFGEEDAPMLEAMQANLDLMKEKPKPINFTVGDRGSKAARDMIGQLAEISTG